MKKQYLSRLSIILVLVLLLTPALSAVSVYSAPAESNIKATISQVLNKVSPSVVGIIGKVKQDKYNSLYGQYAPFGTGVVFKSDGHIITNSHVVADMSDIVVVLSDGKAYKAELKLNDEKSDLAILKIDKSGLVPAVFGDISDITVGETVIAIGTPLSFSLRNSASMGIISGLNRAASGDYKFIQSDVAINGGNSGGPLVTANGRVIGINSVKMAGLGIEGLSFSIPVNTIKYIIDHYDRFGKVRRPFLGAKLVEGVAATYGMPSTEGLTVAEIEKASPAEAAGILTDDVITAINGIKLTSLVDFNEETKKYLPGDVVELAIDRNGTSISIKAAFGEPKAAENEPAASDATQSGGYSINSDGSLSDLSFLVGGIGNTKIGHSYYGWSINVPKASQIISESFNSRNIVIDNQPRSLSLIINANPLLQGWSLDKYYADLKDQRGYYGKVVDSSILQDSNSKYAEFLYKSDRSGSVIRRIYTANNYIYSVALFSDESNPSSLKQNEYYKKLLDSFRLDYKGGSAEIKDISKVVNGQSEYSSYANLNGEDKVKTWQMCFKPDWKPLDSGYDQSFSTAFGKDEKECINIKINSFDEAGVLTEYCQQVLKGYSNNFNPVSYKLLEQKAFAIGGSNAYKLVYRLSSGSENYIYDENYLVHGKFIYKVQIKAPVLTYNAEKASYYKMLDTFKPSADENDKLYKAVEDYEVSLASNAIGKDSSLTDYQNKKQKWTIKIPGVWEKKQLPYSMTGYEAFFAPDNDLGIYIETYDNSKEKAANKYNVDDKNVSAVKFLESIINSTYKSYDSMEEDYGYDVDPYSVYDTAVSDDGSIDDKDDGIIDENLSTLLEDYEGKAGESGIEIKKRQLNANEAAGKKFSSKAIIKDKGTSVTVYSYKYSDPKKEISSTVQIYIFQKGKNLCYFGAIIPEQFSSGANTKLIKDIWASFNVQ